MMFSDWIKEKYERLKANLSPDELTLLEDVAEYEGYGSPIDFVVALVKMELPHYDRNLRFGAWLDEKKKSTSTG